jgi:hypothetical protein
LLDPENSGDVVWGDSAFAGRKLDELLELAGYKLVFTKMDPCSIL